MYRLGKLVASGTFGNVFDVVAVSSEGQVQEDSSSVTLVAKISSIENNCIPDALVRELVFACALQDCTSVAKFVEAGFWHHSENDSKAEETFSLTPCHPDEENIGATTPSRGKKRVWPVHEPQPLTPCIHNVIQSVLILKKYPAGDLYDFVQNHPKALSVDAKIQIFDQLLVGVQSLHAHGVLHVDLKPENILKDLQGVVLTDLGLSVPVDWISSGSHAGTLMYQPPEHLFSNLPHTPASDMWSLGVTAFVYFFGSGLTRQAEQDSSLMQLLHRHFPLLSGWDELTCRKVVHLYGLVSYFGTPSAEWVDKYIDVPERKLFHELFHLINSEGHDFNLHARRNKRSIQKWITKNQTKELQKVFRCIQFSLLQFEPHQRVSARELHKALNTGKEGLAQTCLGTTASAAKVGKPQRATLYAKPSLGIDMESRLQSYYERIEMERLGQETKHSSVLDTTGFIQNVRLGRHILSLYQKQFPSTTEDDLLLVWVVLLWLASKLSLQTDQTKTLSGFADHMFEAKRCPSPETLCKWAMFLLSQYLQEFAHPYTNSV